VSIYVIAAAVGYGPDLQAAEQVIRAAKEAGADAVRFNSVHPSSLAHPVFAADQFERLKESELSRERHFELAGICQDCGIDFLSTPFDIPSVDLICELGAPVIRISSGDATNLPLIAYAAQHDKPLFISTGLCNLAEAADAYYCAIEEGAPQVVLLHSTSAYPTPLTDVNLQALSTLAGELFCEVGYSDHAVGIDCAVGAVALGATVLEKHIRLESDGSAPWACHPAELARLIAHAQQMGIARGSGEKRLMPSEQDLAELIRRSIFYSRDLSAGHQVTWDDLAFLRPVIGLSPAEAYRFIGRTLGVDMQRGELASEQDIAIVEIKSPKTPAEESSAD
jgi:N,N'-diacetyllegionaminate synthase